MDGAIVTGIISETRIAAMIAEPKALPENWREELANLKNRVGRHESEVVLAGEDGTPFRIIVSLRHSSPENFTVILMLNSPTHPNFPLLRYDGSSHDHKNRLEGNSIARKPHSIGLRNVTKSQLTSADLTDMPRRLKAIKT